MTAALEVEGLSVGYAREGVTTTVVHEVGFSIRPGEVLALVGESGSGKTTTAQAVIGLLPANARRSSGRIVLGGTDISDWSQARLGTVRGARIGLIPQDPSASLNPVKPVGVQLGEALRIHTRMPRAVLRSRVLEALDRVGIDDPARRAKQYPHELSGGMRQRVLIASALALEPELVIADEPTSALDVTVQKRILDTIDELRRELGTAVLLVTHDLGVAAERADDIVVLQQGRIRQHGSVDAVLQRPEHPYVRRLFADAPSLSVPPVRPPRAPLYLRDAGAAAAENPYAVEVQGLVREHGRGRTAFRAVDDVSLQVRRGTTHAIVGESGSGKTSIARAIAGFDVPTAGRVIIDGADATGLHGGELRRLRRSVQLVYQNPFGSLDPRQTVSAIVAEPLRNLGIGRAQAAERAAELVDRVALDAALLFRRPRELSGGQRQRVAIARALALDPRILVLDEAVSALDVTVQARILELLDSLQTQLGLTYVFISHDLAVVRRIADTVSVFSRGRLVETGTAEQVFEAPEHDVTRDLLAAVPVPKAVAA
ncbi:ABC transporter ATP-binding protein [Rathayibacter sp. YIM 133350]|uniref:ABC transporter ATP-binding protein n=1 Tax=Rathayibacter sp. YIM 133350 TaxID=3131992 RepID=UPI00307D8AFB